MAVVAFDASFLIALLDPKVQGLSDDPNVDYLFKGLDKAKAKIIIPTPALSEVLIGAGDASQKYLEIISRSARFKVVGFNERAAIEAAAAHREAIQVGDKKEGSESWTKVKFDRQIVAIAKVEGCECIYSNDRDIVRFAKRDGIIVVRLEDLPGPPAPQKADQGDIFDLSPQNQQPV